MPSAPSPAALQDAVATFEGYPRRRQVLECGNVAQRSYRSRTPPRHAKSLDSSTTLPKRQIASLSAPKARRDPKSVTQARFPQEPTSPYRRLTNGPAGT
jgi:hypothetical protein